MKRQINSRRFKSGVALCLACGTAAGFVGAPPVPEIIFVSNRSGIVGSGTPNYNEIWKMNADGTNPVPLTTNNYAEWRPRWNPAGTLIAFAGNRDAGADWNGNWDVYVLDPATSEVTNLTADSLAYDFGSTWSLDGTRIAFTSNRDGNNEIYLVSVVDGSLTRLTNNLASDRDFTWAPDGFRYAFASDRTGNTEIFVADIRVPNAATQITYNGAVDYLPYWSPDGTKIAFTTNRDGNFEVYSMSVNGSSVKRLTNNAADDQESAWSSDSKKLVFTSNRNGNYEIYSMNADGRGSPTRLTNNHPFGDWNAAWK